MINDKYKKWAEDRFPGKGLRPMSNGFMRENLWLRFGKYRDQHPWFILEKDPGYYLWAWENVRGKMPDMLKQFITEFSSDIKRLSEERNKKESNLFKGG
jgi:hypothetical protein